MKRVLVLAFVAVTVVLLAQTVVQQPVISIPPQDVYVPTQPVTIPAGAVKVTLPGQQVRIPNYVTADQVIAIVRAYFATNGLVTKEIITPVIYTKGITNQ